ncbi:MAG: NUDIX hydrolase [Lachnospiraceae bacterium]|nr:NUDIX hydrolase [Lachnospiraceae bacterium]
MRLEERTEKVNDIFEGKIIHVHVDDITLSNGKPGYREVVEHPGGVCIAALTDKNELLFGKQFRYPFKEVTLELPAGKLEKGEEPFVTAQRELKEETGCTGKDWIPMGKMYPSPGILKEVDWLFFCRVDKESKDLELDDDEFIEPLRIPIEKAVEMVMNGEIPDAKTQLLILKAAEYLKR